MSHWVEGGLATRLDLAQTIHKTKGYTMLQKLKARMQAILEMKDAELEVKRKAAIEMLSQVYMHRKYRCDRELEKLKAEIEELKNRRDCL